MQLHVTAGVLAAVITVVHAVQRPVRVRRPDWGRRTLLRTGGVAVVAAGLGVGAITTGAALARAGDRRSTGSFRLDDDEVPVTQWFLDIVPTVDLADVAADRGLAARRAPARASRTSPAVTR